MNDCVQSVVGALLLYRYSFPPVRNGFNLKLIQALGWDGRGELRVELVRRREAERGKPSRMWKRRNEGKEERKERRKRCFREDGTHFIGINAEGWRTLSVKPALKNVVMERARVWGNMRGDDRT